MGCQLALVWQNINSFYVSLIPSADVTPSNRYLYSKMQECCQHAHPKDKRERKGKEQRTISIFLSLTIYIHLLYLLAFCICKKTNGHKSSKHFRSLDSSSLSKKHTGSVYWSKIHSAAVQQTQTYSQNVQWWEEQGVLHSPDSNIIWDYTERGSTRTAYRETANNLPPKYTEKVYVI